MYKEVEPAKKISHSKTNSKNMHLKRHTGNVAAELAAVSGKTALLRVFLPSVISTSTHQKGYKQGEHVSGSENLAHDPLSW